MRTTPTKFEAHRQRDGMRCHAILSITDGSSTWLLSDVDMQLTDGHVYALMDQDWSISSGVDFQRKSWRTGDLTVRLSNLSYKRDADNGVNIRLSDEVSDLVGNDIKLYLVIGSTAAALSDCLLYFSGEVIEAPEYDSETIVIRGEDRGKLWNKIIPEDLMGDTYADCPAKYQKSPIPLVYGRFTFDIRNPYEGLGMAKGFPTTYGVNPKMVFSSHVLHAITEMWLPPIGEYFPLLVPSPTLDDDDSGFGTGIGTTGIAWAYFVPNAAGDRYGYTGEGMNSRPAPVSGHARDYSDNGTVIIGDYPFSFDAQAENEIMAIISQNWDDGNQQHLKIQPFFSMDSGISNNQSMVGIWFATPGTRYNTDPTSTVASGTVYTLSHVVSTPSVPPNIPSQKNERLVGFIQIQSNTGGTGSTNDQNMFAIPSAATGYPFLLIIPLVLLESQPQRYQMVPKNMSTNEDYALAVCEGREFGSWITESGRSVGGFASGDLIEDPAFIIESLLRDELGLTTADIDTASFDAAYDSDIDARLNLTEQKNAFDVIKKIAEQSRFCFAWSTASKARLIPLHVESPTINRTIHFSQIVGDVVVTKSKILAEELRIKHRWMNEYDRFEEDEVRPTVTTQKSYAVEWPNITNDNALFGKTTATIIANHYVGGNPAYTELFSSQHNIVKIRTAGFLNADLEAGDWIELDSASFDPQVKCFGASWSGKAFLIADVKQDIDGTDIEAWEIEVTP